jgi:hypothetical protein
MSQGNEFGAILRMVLLALQRSSFLLAVLIVSCSALALAQSEQAPRTQPPEASAPPAAASETRVQPGQPATGSVTGTIVDQTGAPVAGADIALPGVGQFSRRDVLSDGDGKFYIGNVPAGPFQLTITMAGFSTQVVSGIVQSDENYAVPRITLIVATQVTEVHVGLTEEQIAEDQIKVQEKQRVFGLIPNFYVSYVPDAAPLTWKQKMELAWKSSSDPITLLSVAGVAGVEQATGAFAEYGSGAQGYAKRFGATYADVVSGTFLGSAIFPALFRQDPRYFYKGTGSTRSRILYALRSAFVCKSDDKTWGPNYSNVLGNLAAGGLANLYYPANKRGVGLTFETAGIRIGETAVAGVFQEFIIRKLTPNARPRNVSQP